MPLISRLGAASSRGFGQFTQQVSGKYIEDYFSTYLYTGNGSSQTINNGIGLSDTAAWSSFTATQVSDVEVWDVTTDSSGNFYTVGRANDGTGNSATVIKYNSTGVVQWQRRWYQSGWTPYGFGVTVDSSGNVFVCGAAYDGTRYNGIVIKYNSSGVIQWYRKMFSGQTYLRKVCLDTSGNIYGVGYFQPSTDYNIYIVKLDSSGAIVWERKLYEGASFGYGIGIDSSNNIYVTGFANDANRQYAILAKYDSSGAIQWQKKTYEATYSSSGTSVFVDSSNNVFVAGIAFDGTRTHATIQKFNTSGNRAWSRKYYQNTSYGYGVTADSSGNSYLVGSINSNKQWFVSKYNSSGAIQWQRFLSYTTNSGVANKVASDTSGNIFIAGTFIEPTISNSVAIVSKILADGSTTSGQAYLTMDVGSGTDAIGGQTVAGGTALDQAQGTTTSTTGATDATGTLTTATYTQSAVTGAGGLVWLKNRTGIFDHWLWDTSRGAGYSLNTNNTGANVNIGTTEGVSFTASGFSFGNNINWNQSGTTAASWTFREQPKFFDIVTYTGNGVAGRTISHNLGSVPGMILVKRTSGTATNWAVYHISVGNTDYLVLNTTDNPVTNSTYWNNATPTSTDFSLGTASAVNANGSTYVAYLFAHNAGGFGTDGSQNVVSCGIFTTNGSGTATVSLGYEPQFIIVKEIDTGSGPWIMLDTMRGWNLSSSDAEIRANSTAAESSVDHGNPTATGFVYTDAGFANTRHIYMAIRRGPMRTPTSGTSVYSVEAHSGVALNTKSTYTTNFPVDTVWQSQRPGGSARFLVTDRLRAQSGTTSSYSLQTSSTAAENAINGFASLWFDNNTGFSVQDSNGSWNGTSTESAVSWSFRRAPGFFDVVCYTGTGSSQNVSHNLGVTPLFMMVKSRSYSPTEWIGYHTFLGANKVILPNRDYGAIYTGSQWFGTAPTSSVFTVNTDLATNSSGQTYVAYLFASCPGVSSVGSYTGTGSTQTINCGFSGGARYVVIKRTDSNGSWWVWDTARGMVAGTDPRLAYNSTAAETNANWVYTTTGGFQIVTSDATVNASGGTYIYLAIA